jgi:hypothetical protein
VTPDYALRRYGHDDVLAIRQILLNVHADAHANQAGMPREGQLATERLGWGDAAGALQRRLSWPAARSDIDTLVLGRWRRQSREECLGGQQLSPARPGPPERRQSSSTASPAKNSVGDPSTALVAARAVAPQSLPSHRSSPRPETARARSRRRRPRCAVGRSRLRSQTSTTSTPPCSRTWTATSASPSSAGYIGLGSVIPVVNPR